VALIKISLFKVLQLLWAPTPSPTGPSGIPISLSLNEEALPRIPTTPDEPGWTGPTPTLLSDRSTPSHPVREPQFPKVSRTRCRPITILWISLVPSPISQTLASLIIRSTG